MSDFTAIDFETATGDRSSICQIGLVIVEQCKIIDKIKYFVKPPGNLYSQRNIDIHGIKPENTIAARSFGEIYPEIEIYLKGRSVVAHNAHFDISCLGQILVKCGIPSPPVRLYCTGKIYNLNLADACKKHGIIYTPHDALSDAEACALLMIKDILR